MQEQECNMDMFKNVPFGNSIFQIQHFTDGKETLQRRYRHCLLQLDQKLRALKECEFRRKRLEIDIEEIVEKLTTSISYETKRLQVDLEEKKYYLEIEAKLIEDCLIEVAVYKKILSGLPEYSREEFEASEPEYWGKRLLNDAQREVTSMGYVTVQTIQSLENIGIKVGRNEKGQIAYTKGEKNNDFLRLNQTNKS